MTVTGQCHCGAIAYMADVDPARVQVCHCTDCQRLTGSAYRVSVGAPAPTFKLRVGGLDQRAQLAPAKQIRCRSALPWAMNLDDLPRVEKQ